MTLPGKTKPQVDQEQQQREAERTVAEAKQELERIDMAAIRPLRAKLNGNDTQADRDKLAELEAQADEQRKIIREAT